MPETSPASRHQPRRDEITVQVVTSSALIARWRGRFAARFALALIVAALAGACGSDAPDNYSADVRESFMTGCIEDSGNADLVEVCECAYDTAAADLPFEQFKAAEQRLQDGSPEVSDAVVEIILGCIREVSARR